MTEKNSKPGPLAQPAPRPGLIKTSTAILFVIMAFALGLYGGHLISSLMNESEPRITKQSIRQAEAAPQAELGPAEREKLAALREAAQAPQARAEDWNRLAHLYFELGQLENAASAYTRSLAFKPGDSTVMTHLGMVYRGLHRHEQALEYFQLAAQADPANETALYYTGIACLDTGDRAGAVKAWQALQKHNPGFVTPMGPTISQALEMLKQQ